MTHTTPRNRIAAFLALALAVGAVAVPTASGVPIDPWAGGLVHSPDVHKVPPRAKRKVTKRSDIQFGGVIGSLDSHKVPPRTAKKQPLETRSGR
jgi:hypothetical protein